MNNEISKYIIHDFDVKSSDIAFEGIHSDKFWKEYRNLKRDEEDGVVPYVINEKGEEVHDPE